MNRKDLDALNELYLSVYVWEDVENWVSSLLEEGYDLSDYTWEEMYEAYLEEKDVVQLPGGKSITMGTGYNATLGGQPGQLTYQRTPGSTNRVQRTFKANPVLSVKGGVKGTGVGNDFKAQSWSSAANARYDNQSVENKRNASKALVDATNKNPNIKPDPNSRSTGSEVNPPSQASSRQAASTRPSASGPVLSKKGGVEGTGVGANFKPRAFTDAEKSRYSSVAAQNSARSSTSPAAATPAAAQNSARTSASSGAATPAAAQPKPATPTGPAVGKLGNTSFERRTPTSAELRAAQTARAGGASPEKALQAAQKTNLPTTGPTPAIPDLKSVNTDLAKANSPAVINRPAPAGSALAKQQAQQKLKPPTPGTGNMQNQSYEWPSAKTIRDIAGAYASIYEAKKKVDQDQDGDNDFADVRIARMIASGMTKAQAIAMVKDKSYNEEVELWVNELIEEGYDLSEYTWEDMFEIYLDEATRMRKELGKEGEIATRQELARRSNAYQRSGSVDRTIAAAERGAKNPYVVRGKNETEAEHNKRKQAKSQTLTRLASNRRGSVRDKPRAGLRGYAAKVEGSDRDLQSARSSARVAGTLTPREKKELNREAYAAYEFVASYLLENNFASTVDDANVIINNMSEGWFDQIMEDVSGVSYNPNPIGNAIRAGAGLLKNTMNRPSVQGAIKTGSQMLQKSVPSGGYSTREGDGKPRETPLWDGPSKPTPTIPTKPQTKKQPPMRDEPLW